MAVADAQPPHPSDPGDEAPQPPVNVFDFEAIARTRLAPATCSYIWGAAGDELSLGRNRASFDTLLLKPRVLRNVSRLDTKVEICGQTMPFPILLAPTAYHKMVHPEGECATARAAAVSGTTMVVSSFATTAVEEIALAAAGAEPGGAGAPAPGCNLWYQLYVQPDRAFTRDLVQRVEAAGCKALCITVDTPVLGTRNRETRDRFTLAPGLERANMRGCKAAAAGHFDESGVYSDIIDPTLTWDEIDWIRGFAKVPILLKGILAPEDGALAVEHGVAGIIVSNHGARNLDTTPATIEALPWVADAVAGRIPILLDGGIRRGTDVVKALALGARAVLIGRPHLWALAAGGADGVAALLKILHTELLTAMALCGVTDLAAIDRGVLWPVSA